MVACVLAFNPCWDHVNRDLLDPSGEIIFLIDRSGSMAGDPMKNVCETMDLFLRSLPENCKFNIVGFGSSFTKLFDSSAKYNDDTLAVGCAHVTSLKADLGGTYLSQPLSAVLEADYDDAYPRQVFLLTDGAVDSDERAATINVATKHCDKVRVFTFGIGSGVDKSLVTQLAEIGRGHAEFIESSGQIKEKVIAQLQRALEPMMKQVQVVWPLLPPSSTPSPTTPATTTATPPAGVVVAQAPSSIRPLFSGEHLVVYSLLPSALTLLPTPTPPTPTPSATTTAAKGSPHPAAILRGVGPDGSPLEFPIELTPERVSYGKMIHQLAAKNIIRELENTPKGRHTVDVDARILALSLEWNVVCTRTAFISVEQREEGTAGTMQQVAVAAPSQPPPPNVDVVSCCEKGSTSSPCRHHDIKERIKLLRQQIDEQVQLEQATIAEGQKLRKKNNQEGGARKPGQNRPDNSAHRHRDRC
eukprot:TRINITY_DN2711_c0_g1_i1.p1 TRINITY_DN2711_c0_g1~~TRINITY_DN2711_c0_g1_i1.p1  ORF type:complete len:472 (+),score=103.81 TRINITY_DN2711_c0_g1_i1:559-1974(+)